MRGAFVCAGGARESPRRSDGDRGKGPCVRRRTVHMYHTCSGKGSGIATDDDGDDDDDDADDADDDDDDDDDDADDEFAAMSVQVIAGSSCASCTLPSSEDIHISLESEGSSAGPADTMGTFPLSAPSTNIQRLLVLVR